MMMRMIKKTLIINASVICTTSHNSWNLLKMLHVMHIAKFALDHLALNKQASQSSQIINRAWQSAGVNTDEEQLHLFHWGEGCKLNRGCFRNRWAGSTKGSLGLCQQVVGTRWFMHWQQLQLPAEAAETKAQLLGCLHRKNKTALLWEGPSRCAPVRIWTTWSGLNLLVSIPTLKTINTFFSFGPISE